MDILEVALGPADFYAHDLFKRLSPVSGATDDRQDDLAETRRHAASVEYGHGVFSVPPPGGLCLLAFGQPPAEAAATNDASRRASGFADHRDAGVPGLHHGAGVGL